MKQIAIPLWRFKGIYSHLRRIAQYAKATPGDNRTGDALRLARKDLQYLQRNFGQHLPQPKKQTQPIRRKTT